MHVPVSISYIWIYPYLVIRYMTSYLGDTCIATGKSFWASAGKNTSTAFLGNGWLPAGVWPTSEIILIYIYTLRYIKKKYLHFLNTQCLKKSAESGERKRSQQKRRVLTVGSQVSLPTLLFTGRRLKLKKTVVS